MKKYQKLLLIGLLFIAVLAFYPVLKADFSDADGKVFVEDNWKINSFPSSNLKELLFKPHYRLYQPLVNLSFAFENYFFGKDPYFYHAGNLIIYILNILLVFFVLYSIAKKRRNIFLRMKQFAFQSERFIFSVCRKVI